MTDEERITKRGQLKEGMTLFYYFRQQGAMYQFEEGDIVTVKESTNQKAPVDEELTIVDTLGDEATVESEGGNRYILSLNGAINGDGPKFWLYDAEGRESRGEVWKLGVVELQDDFVWGEDR
jgi:hypothetical protein